MKKINQEKSLRVLTKMNKGKSIITEDIGMILMLGYKQEPLLMKYQNLYIETLPIGNKHFKVFN